MFLRSKKRFKDGKEYRYWSVVESRRIVAGFPRGAFGRLEALRSWHESNSPAAPGPAGSWSVPPPAGGGARVASADDQRCADRQQPIPGSPDAVLDPNLQFGSKELCVELVDAAIHESVAIAGLIVGCRVNNRPSGAAQTAALLHQLSQAGRACPKGLRGKQSG